jgi:hypothetical protein
MNPTRRKRINMVLMPKLSKWQTLFRNFEGSVNDFENISAVTDNIDSTKDFSNSQMLQSLAREISRLVQEKYSHYQIQREMYAKASESYSSSEEKPEEENYTEFENQLKELIGETPEIIDSNEGETTHYHPVDASQIELCEITEDTKVQVKVFPLSFRCSRCGHFEIIDPRTKSDLKCHCCKPYCIKCKKEFEKNVGSNCPDCGSVLFKREIEQFSYVLACPRCANMEEFTPRTVKIKDVRGSLITCPDCKKGHLHFYMGESFQTAHWGCSGRNCSFNKKRSFSDKKLDKFCKCNIRSVDGEPGRPSNMKPTPTSASSLTFPLTRSYLYLGTDQVSLEKLEQRHEETKAIDLYRWRLNENVTEIDKKMIMELFGIEDVFTVPEITTISAVYGYKSGIQSHPVIIPDNEKLAHLFKHGRKYRVYIVTTKGRCLVIKFDKNRLLELLHETEHNSSETYEDIVENEINYLMTEDFQKIIENPSKLPLISLLHALEHAFLQCAMNQIGLESFGSKILIRDCSIVLYEREEIGSGGLVQLTLGNECREFKKYLHDIKRKIDNCPQLCKEACPACVFINDFYCQPFMPNEIERWFPPNSLLNREYANKFIRGIEASELNNENEEN